MLFFIFNKENLMLKNKLIYIENQKESIRVAYRGMFFPLIQKIGILVIFYCYEEKNMIECWIDSVSHEFKISFVNYCVEDDLLEQGAREYTEYLIKNGTAMQRRILSGRIESKPFSFRNFKRNTRYSDIVEFIANFMYSKTKK